MFRLGAAKGEKLLILKMAVIAEGEQEQAGHVSAPPEQFEDNAFLKGTTAVV